ncbi:hypothetical protein QYM36_005441 [Artemia franciscana]|uniref:Uncharacterized protein n=1 Tax=Artemia franciscana TaxID=6661 RepID=A0AA88I140_ARTSF|nr:hypothetical protein QYM36_005441 [Artemia franciscana]
MNESKNLIWNAVLNYLLKSMHGGIPKDEIVRTCTDFVKRESMKEAKIFIYSIVLENVHRSMRQKGSENVLDIIKILKEFDVKSIELSTFVIAEPQEVPSRGSQISALVTRNISELNTKVDALIAKSKELAAPSEKS